MTQTNDLIIERVQIAKAIRAARLTLCNEWDADATFMAEPLQSQYVAFKVCGETFTIRIADHVACKPGMSECIYDTSRNLNVADIVARINAIATDSEAFHAAFDECGDLDDARKFVASRIV